MADATKLGKRRTSRRTLAIHAHYDDETGGWWADSDDIPGLVTEAPTYEALVERVRAVAADLCEANNVAVAKGDILQIQRVGEAQTPATTKAEFSGWGDRLWREYR